MKNNNVDLSVDFCGFHLRSPFLLASAPPAANGEMIMRAFDTGWAGAATKTLALKPTPNVEPRFASSHSGKKLIGFENIEQITDIELDIWLLDIKKIKKKYPDRLLIVSIMATDDLREWQELTEKVQSAGADMIELNLSCPHMAKEGLGSDVGQDPVLTIEAVRMVKEVSIVPVIAKLTAGAGDIVAIAKACEDAGADGITAIGSLRAMKIDIETGRPVLGNKMGGLSGSCLKPIAVRCVYEISREVSIPVIGCGGITTGEDAIEYFMAGANAVQIGTGILSRGITIFKKVSLEIKEYMKENGYSGIDEIIGLAL